MLPGRNLKVAGTTKTFLTTFPRNSLNRGTNAAVSNVGIKYRSSKVNEYSKVCDKGSITGEGRIL